METSEEENFGVAVSSPSDAEFDAVVGYLEDIIMSKLSKQTRWVLKMLHTHSQSTLCLLVEALFPFFSSLLP